MKMQDLSKASFFGFKRQNGRVGVRNHVIILPVDDLSNAAAEAVANNIKGTLALPHAYGRLQFGEDLALHFRTLIGTGANPNVAAVVVIGIEDGWAKKVADGIAATGKPVSFFGIEQHGDHDTIMRASKKAKEYVQWASELRREERPLKDLWVSTKCGESDTTSGCGANPTVGNAFDKLYPHGVTLVFGESDQLPGLVLGKSLDLPVIARNLLGSIHLLSTTGRLFADKCVAGIEANVRDCIAIIRKIRGK